MAVMLHASIIFSNPFRSSFKEVSLNNPRTPPLLSCFINVLAIWEHSCWTKPENAECMIFTLIFTKGRKNFEDHTEDDFTEKLIGPSRGEHCLNANRNMRNPNLPTLNLHQAESKSLSRLMRSSRRKYETEIVFFVETCSLPCSKKSAPNAD